MNLLKKKIFNVVILLFFVVSCASDDGKKVTIEMIEKIYTIKRKAGLKQETMLQQF